MNERTGTDDPTPQVAPTRHSGAAGAPGTAVTDSRDAQGGAPPKTAPEIAYWNHRLMTAPEGSGEALVLTEVYYDAQDTPIGYVADGVNFGGDTPDEVRQALAHAHAACAKPVLTPADFSHGDFTGSADHRPHS